MALTNIFKTDYHFCGFKYEDMSRYDFYSKNAKNKIYSLTFEKKTNLRLFLSSLLASIKKGVTKLSISEENNSFCMNNSTEEI